MEDNKQNDLELIESKYKIESDCSEEVFLSVSRLYAREVVSLFGLNVCVTNFEWKVSRRAKRRAGVVKFGGRDARCIILSWDLFQNSGWEEVTSTIRHELIHVHLMNSTGDMSHGKNFERLADKLNTEIECEKFVSPKWWVECVECGKRSARYNKTKVIENINDYKCKSCGGDLKYYDS